MHRDHEVAAEEAPEIEGLDVVLVIRLGHEAHRTDDHQSVGRVLLVLHASIRRERVLDAQRMELKDLLEERVLVAAVHIDVHPEQSFGALKDRGELARIDVALHHARRIAVPGARPALLDDRFPLFAGPDP